MANIVREIRYRCSDDCVMSGCPGHIGRLFYQSVADTYRFDMNGREISFERGELDAVIVLLKSLNRVDAAGGDT